MKGHLMCAPFWNFMLIRSKLVPTFSQKTLEREREKGNKNNISINIDILFCYVSAVILINLYLKMVFTHVPIYTNDLSQLFYHSVISYQTFEVFIILKEEKDRVGYKPVAQLLL